MRNSLQASTCPEVGNVGASSRSSPPWSAAASFFFLLAAAAFLPLAAAAASSPCWPRRPSSAFWPQSPASPCRPPSPSPPWRQPSLPRGDGSGKRAGRDGGAERPSMAIPSALDRGGPNGGASLREEAARVRTQRTRTGALPRVRTGRRQAGPPSGGAGGSAQSSAQRVG